MSNFQGYSNPSRYISTYAEHYANSSSSQYGLLNMILPFATILSKLFFCSLADRYQAHRSFFIWFLIAALIGFGSFGVLPFFITPQPKDLGLNQGVWLLICLMTSVSIISMSVISCLSDAFAMNSSRKNSSSYGIIRVWGTFGWGASALVISFINSTKQLPLLVPGLFMTIILIALDTLFQIYWPHQDDYRLDKSVSDVGFETNDSRLAKSESKLSDDATSVSRYGTTEMRNVQSTPESCDILNQRSHQAVEHPDIKTQWLLFKEVAKRRKSLFRYMGLFTISGALISIQWSYFFLYLSGVYSEDFTYISGLSMVSQSFLGELPFFMLAQHVIKLFGRTHTLSFSIITIGIRYLLYEYLLPNNSMYFVLLTETFHGPNFGLFYVVMTEVGLDYSDCDEAISEIVNQGLVPNSPNKLQQLRLALRATMQSLVSACYEGLGLGIGAIVGGIVIDKYGFNFLWHWASIIAIILGFLNMTIDLLKLPVLTDEKPREQSNLSVP